MSQLGLPIFDYTAFVIIGTVVVVLIIVAAYFISRASLKRQISRLAGKMLGDATTKGQDDQVQRAQDAAKIRHLQSILRLFNVATTALAFVPIVFAVSSLIIHQPQQALNYNIVSLVTAFITKGALLGAAEFLAAHVGGAIVTAPISYELQQWWKRWRNRGKES
jgi:hypothetical protein